MHLFERLVTLLDHQLQKVVQQQCAHPRVVQLHFGTLLAQLFLNAPQRIQRQLSVWKAGASDKSEEIGKIFIVPLGREPFCQEPLCKRTVEILDWICADKPRPHRLWRFVQALYSLCLFFDVPKIQEIFFIISRNSKLSANVPVRFKPVVLYPPLATSI